MFYYDCIFDGNCVTNSKNIILLVQGLCYICIHLGFLCGIWLLCLVDIILVQFLLCQTICPLSASCVLPVTLCCLFSYFCFAGLQFGTLMPGIKHDCYDRASAQDSSIGFMLKIGFVRFYFFFLQCGLFVQSSWPQSSQVDHILIVTWSARLHCKDADIRKIWTPLCK